MKKNQLYKAIVLGGLICLPLGNANANVIATAAIEFTDFRIYGQITGGAFRQLDAADFDTLIFNSTADADATLFGTTEAITGAIDGDNFGIDFPNPPYPGGTTQSPPGNDLCVGDCGGALVGTLNDNGYPHIDAAAVAGAALGSYSWSDQSEIGSPITGQTDGLGVPVAPQADVGNGAFSHISDTDSGNGGANSDNGLNATFEFVPSFDLDFIEVEFTIDSFAYAFLSAVESIGLAKADTLYALNLPGFSWDFLIGGAPIPGNPSVPLIIGGNSALKQTPGTSMSVTPGAPVTLRYRTTTGLLAGSQYDLDARLEANTEVKRIPEPAVLGLMGLGMLGFGAMRRRRLGS